MAAAQDMEISRHRSGPTPQCLPQIYFYLCCFLHRRPLPYQTVLSRFQPRLMRISLEEPFDASSLPQLALQPLPHTSWLYL